MSADDCFIGKLPHRRAAREVAAAFAALSGYSNRPEIKPIIERVSGSLYAQVRDRLKIKVEAAGKSDAEIKAEIEAKLAAAGYTGAQVSVTTSPDGKRQVNLLVKDQDSGEEYEGRLRLEADSADTFSFSLPDRLPSIGIDTEGKSDAQIEAEVKARLAEQGITEAEIEIITNPDGGKEVRVRIEKEKTIEE
jgi:hypothetical protein